MAEIGDNNPPVILELTQEEAAFLAANADEAMEMGLKLLQMTGKRELLEKVVASMEGWRPLRDKLRKARG